jgi:ABC-2 type transport system ATP-binding protein
MAIIEVKNLVKHYKKTDKNAVDNISLEVEEGEFFAFLGPNGAGKTTTISILTTTLNKTSGEVVIAGHNLDDDESTVRRNIGIIFQNPSLDLNLSGEENIRFHAALFQVYPFRPTYNLMPKEYKDKVQRLAKVLDMQKEIFDPVKSYSGGMKRKLEIVRSLVHEPKVLFLDEPTTGLDPLSRRNLWDYLDKVRREQGTTIFLTTHYLDEAENADRVCIIKDGKIVKLGTPERIKEDLLHDYLILDTDDREALRTELKAMKLKFAEKPHFQIELSDKSVQDIIRKIKTQLTVTRTHSPSLEEAYVDIVGRSNVF